MDNATFFVHNSSVENNAHINLEPVEPRLQTKYLEYLWNNNQVIYILFGWISCILGSSGLIGNVLTLTVLFKKSMRHTPVNKLLAALTSWDIVVIVSFMCSYDSINAASQLFRQDSEYSFFWLQSLPVIYPIFLIASTASMIITVIVTYERFICVCYPLSSQIKNSSKRVNIQILLSSGLVILIHVPFFWWLEVLEVEHNKLKLVFTAFAIKYGLTKLVSFNTRGIIVFLIRYILPFVFMCYLNCKIILVVRKLSTVRKTISASDVKAVGVTKVVIAIVSVSMLTNIFFFSFVAHVQSSGSEASAVYFGSVYSLVILLNSSINFVFYCVFGQKFRREGKAMLVCFLRIIALAKSRENSTTVTTSDS